MKYLVILRGFPASGKSSWIKENNLEPYTLSSDTYRLHLTSFTPNLDGEVRISQKYNGEMWKRFYSDLEFRMKHGEFTIVDATHLTRKSIEKYKKLVKKYFYRMILIEFNADKETCIKRDSLRGKYSVGREVIESMEKEELPKSILRVEPNDFMSFINSRYKTIDLNKYDNVHVIGDIHGCYTVLNDFMSDNDAFIFVGDYFDRGIENYFVYDFISNKIENNNFFFVKGNHEQRIIEYLNGEEKQTQFLTKTLPELQRNGVTDKDLRHFISKLYSFVDFTYGNKRYIVSHAGITNESCINPFTAEDVFVQGVGRYADMQKVCETYAKTSSAIQIFGHRNNDDVAIKINDVCYNLCGFPEYGGTLKAITINKDGIKEHYIKNDIFNREEHFKIMAKRPDLYPITNVGELIGVFRYDKYIKESEYGDISSFNFTKDAFYNNHWTHTTTKARGLFVNTRTNKIVARSYNKFFLLNQYEHSTLDKFTPPYTIYTKYDGFLAILSCENDNLIFCSKSTIAPYGEYAEWFREAITPHIKDGLKDFLRKNNISLVFECILPEKDEHIIKYKKDRIIFLDAISNTIEYNKPFTYSYYHKILVNYFDSFIELKHYLGTYQTLITNYWKNNPYMEGYVIEDANGNMFKLKTYTYEAKKILRGLKEFYETLDSRHIKMPTKEKITQKYCSKFEPCVIDMVYEGLVDIIKDELISSR